MTNKNKIITVFGTSKAVEQDPEFILAEQLGKAIILAGFNLANGGYGGTMLASARGAAIEGGTVYGVTCSAFKRSKPNPHTTEEISTPNLKQRLAKLVELGDAYVVLPGGTGTLLELADVWEHKNKGFANADKPIILVGEFWSPLVVMMQQADPRTQHCIHLAQNTEQVIEILKEVLK